FYTAGAVGTRAPYLPNSSSDVQEYTAPLRSSRPLIPQDMAIVAAGILLQIRLVVRFRREKDAGFDDFRYDGSFPFPGFVNLRLDLLGGFLLLFRVIKDRRSILCPHVV